MSGRTAAAATTLVKVISFLLSSYPNLGLDIIQSVLQVHDGDREQAVGTLRAIHEELGDEATIHKSMSQFGNSVTELLFYQYRSIHALRWLYAHEGRSLVQLTDPYEHPPQQ